MKLSETVMVSEWIDGNGWLYEDSVVSFKEMNFPYILDYDFKEFNWSDYESYYSSPLPKGTDLYLTVVFLVNDCHVCTFSEWVSVLQSYNDVSNDVCV